jgi:cobalt/nickel transport system permease protein
MTDIGSQLFDIGHMDSIAAGDSPMHRLDPRVKLAATLAFIVAVVSFDKYAISALIPFFIFPVVQISMGGLPAGYIFKKVILVAPFAVLIGIFNPLLDREVLLQIGSFHFSGGWVSFCSILVRFFLTVTAALTLIASTGFHSVCVALVKLGVPRPFVVQLMFLYRYLFVLTDEAARMVRAVSLKTFNGGIRFKTFVSMTGHLLLRTLDRAQRIHMAMLCRGFDGRIRVLRSMKIGWTGTIFVVGWSMLFLVFRLFNIPKIIGDIVTGCF